MQQDVIRLIRDKQPRGVRSSMPEIAALVQRLTDAEDLQRFTKELLVARQITAALRQAGVRPTHFQEATK